MFFGVIKFGLIFTMLYISYAVSNDQILSYIIMSPYSRWSSLQNGIILSSLTGNHCLQQRQ